MEGCGDMESRSTEMMDDTVVMSDTATAPHLHAARAG